MKRWLVRYESRHLASSASFHKVMVKTETIWRYFTLILVILVSNLSVGALPTLGFSVLYTFVLVSPLSLIRDSYYLKADHLCAWKCQHTEGISGRDAIRASARFSESHSKIAGQLEGQPECKMPSLVLVATICIALPPQPYDLGTYESWLG